MVFCCSGEARQVTYFEHAHRVASQSYLDKIFFKARNSLLQIFGIVEEAIAMPGTRRLLASPHLSCT